MKAAKQFFTLSVVLLAGLATQAQGSFENLDFEQANPVNAGNREYLDAVTFSSALPGWSASIGGEPVTDVLLNGDTEGGASIDLFGPGWNSVNPGIIDGNYTVFLQAGGSWLLSVGGNVSLWQTGTIPANARTLEYKAWNFSAGAPLSVSVDGNSLSAVVLSSGQSPSGQAYSVYGVDIAPYAGQTGEVEFTEVFTNVPSWTELDDITFSTTTVAPEPNTLALAVMGGLALAARRWHKRGA
jgi:hypothetical protein